MVEGGLPSAPVPLEKARERGKTGKAKDYSQAMFNQLIRRETKLKLSRRSGEIDFPPSSCPNGRRVSQAPDLRGQRWASTPWGFAGPTDSSFLGLGWLGIQTRLPFAEAHSSLLQPL